MGRKVGGEFFRFAVSTCASALVTLGVPLVLHETVGVEQRAAVAISQATALLLNFLMIRIFVFRSNRAAARDFAYYLGSAAAFRGLEYLLFLVLFEVGKLYYLTALVATLGMSTMLKFVWYRYIFGKQAERLA